MKTSSARETKPHKSSNITWSNSIVTREERCALNKHGSCALWLTGLSGSGKSTIAFAIEKELYRHHINSYVLDGDNIRHGLNRDLAFTEEDRAENIRRIGEVSKLFVDAGMVVIAAFISPNEGDRATVKELFLPHDFIEIYIKCSLEECERRDPKGLYRQARNGSIPNFTGISAPYDVPVNPAITIDTEQLSVEQAVQLVLDYLKLRHDIA
ncbi:putative adenylyl-sulfate kinase [Paenibacillus plantiphilus]|uniref:Adenylyl-sulfate kinase n=1 Tax=Paenibacillus plantiphilus TaxID=2905650 RepID=A0ABM9CFQ9_9BACL|nr:adenylyl-sulfate kinase [Paenibacillus plantiphilus]CAH1210898.1 putative adenylyl-sulfate kinase [Paenibacillus plantiphilus]